MAKKEMTSAEVDKFVASYAKKHEVSEAEAKRRILATGVSRLKALGTYAATQSGGAKPAKKAAAKSAKAANKPAKKAAKKAPKKAPKKAAKKATKAAPVSEGEEG